MKKTLAALKNQTVMVEPFHVPLIVAFGRKQAEKFLKKGFKCEPPEQLESCSGFATELANSKGQLSFFVMMPKVETEAITWHEALHLATYVLDYVGVKTDPDNHEILCYLQDHIVRLIRGAYENKSQVN